MLKTTKFFAGMALRCLAVLLSFLMAGGVMASAQQKNISLKVSNVSVESALNTVKSQYGISIVTQIEGLDLSSKVLTSRMLLSLKRSRKFSSPSRSTSKSMAM